MKKFYFSTLFIFTFCFSIWAQCPNATVRFIYQHELNAFAVDYPNCTHPPVNIIIGDDTGSTVSNITDLSPLSNIEFSGGLRIYNVDNLESLAGLENLTTINGALHISSNDALSDLSGLNGLDFVADFIITENSQLVNLDGLGDNFVVFNSILIEGNHNLMDIMGLSNLTSIYGHLIIQDNLSLVNLEGLNNLTNVGFYMRINNNDALEDVTALNNLEAINGYLTIIGNDNLVSLEGMGNIDYTTINSYFWIFDNSNLSVCNVEMVCDYISNGGNASIYNNALGCDNRGEVVSTCPGECPPENVLVFTSQQEIDDFAVNYPNCTYLSGSMVVGRNDIPSDIYDLSPLDQLTAIREHVDIVHNDSLSALDGLTNLTIIGGHLLLADNSNLTNLNSLENLIAIGGDLEITGNAALVSLAELQNINSINGVLNVSNNSELNSLNGLENIEYSTITNMIINDNPNLSVCYVESVCNYLVSGGPPATISNNDFGCNTAGEVQSTCIALPVELIEFTAEAQRNSVLLTWITASETNNQGFEIQRSKDGINWEKIGYQQGAGNSTTVQSYRYNDNQPLSGINYYRLLQVDIGGEATYSNIVNVVYESSGFSVFPVPAKDEITLQLESSQTVVEVNISNIVGEVIHIQELQLPEGVHQFTFDISNYTNGVYFLTINNGDKKGTQRFVKH